MHSIGWEGGVTGDLAESPVTLPAPPSCEGMSILLTELLQIDTAGFLKTEAFGSGNRPKQK